MADIFEREGIAPPTPVRQSRDIFAEEGISLPPIAQQNRDALTNTVAIEQLPQEAQASFSADDDLVNTLASSRFSEDQLQQMKAKGPIGWWEADDFYGWSDVLPGGGLKQAYDTYGLIRIADKLQNGEELSAGERQTFDAFVDKQVEMSVRGFSIGGNIRRGVVQMPAFMVEFALSGGAGKIAATAATKAVGKVATSAALKAATGFAVAGATRVAASPMLYSNFGDIRLNEHVAITDKGQVLLKEAKESPAKSALKAFGYTSAEIASELAGGQIGKYIVNPVTKRLKTPLVTAAAKLPVGVRTALYEAYKKVQPNASVSKMFSAGGWNGFLEELGEERIADVLRGAVDLSTDADYTFDNYLDAITPSKDQLLVEAGIIAIAGGSKASASIVMNSLIEKGATPAEAKEIVSNLTTKEIEGAAEESIQKPVSETRAVNSTEVVGAQLDAAGKADPPKINSEESFFDNFYREWVDRFSSVENAEELAVERGADIKVGESPTKLARLYSGVVGMAQQNLQVATYTIGADGKAVVTGKGLKPILDDFSNTFAHIEADVDVREADFHDYLEAKRNLEDLKNRGGVKVSEETIMRTEANLARLEGKYGQEFVWFEVFAKEIYEYQRRVLMNFVDSGNIAKERYDEIIKANPNYVPFDRIFEEEQDFKEMVSSKGIFTNARASEVLKKLLGSDRKIKNVFHSITKNTVQIVELAHRNRVAKNLAELSTYIPEYIQAEKPIFQKITVDGKETYRPSPIAPQGTITVFEGGKKKYYKVSQPILEAMQSFNPVQLGFLRQFFTLPGALVRAGATLVPEFWIRNVLRDQTTALLQAKARPTPIDMVHGLTAIMGKNNLYNDWMRSGGSFNSYMALDDTGMDKAYKELFRKNGRLSRYLNPVTLLSDVSMGLDQATRIGVFRASQRAGMSGVESALEAREGTIDFSRGGEKSRTLNQFIPFFNVGVQGVDKMLRTFKSNPKALTMYGIATITMPSVMLAGYYLYGAPDDERKEYLEIPQWQKDMFWVVKVDGEWRRYPKPFSYGYLFGSVPERFMTWMYKGDKPEGEQFYKDLVMGIGGALSPVYDPSSLLPPLVKVSVEAATGYNFFLGRDIYPEWMGRLDPERRYSKYTSETAKEIGSLMKVSPAVVENTARGLLAGASDYAFDAGDIILNAVKKWNGVDVTEKPLTDSDIPIIKAFSVRSPLGSRANSTQVFYDKWSEIQQRHNTHKDLEGDEKAAYAEDHAAELALYKPFKGYSDKIAKINKQIGNIFDDPDMDGQEKVRQISVLEAQVSDIAFEANKYAKGKQ